MAKIAPFGRFRAFDNQKPSLPLGGGKLFTYESGTTTPKPTYSEVNGLILNTNPVILDADGYADVWLGSGLYRFVLMDKNNVVIFTEDGISGETNSAFGNTSIVITTSTIIDSSFKNTVLLCNGTSNLTLTLLPSATAGDGFYFVIKNNSNFNVTIDPNLSETINGGLTQILSPNQSALVICNGLNWSTVFDIPNNSITSNMIMDNSLTTSKYLDNSVTNAKLANMVANTIKSNSAASSAVPTDLALAPNTFPARTSSSNIVAATVSDFAFTILDDANAPAVRSTIGAGQDIINGTSQTATGTVVPFLTIPSGIKRLAVKFFGVSLNADSNILIQLGTSAGFITTGYVSTGTLSGANNGISTSGGFVFSTTTAASTQFGTVVFDLFDNIGVSWIGTGSLSLSGASLNVHTAGGVTLPATLDRIRITTVGGTAAFDAGFFNISWEF